MQTNTETTVSETLDPRALGTRLREAREAAGLSRPALAKQSGISAKIIEKFEAGTQEPSVSRMLRLCETLHIPLASITNADHATVSPEPDNESGQEYRPMMVQEPDETPDDPETVINLLERLDEMRQDGFEGTRRRAMVLIGELGTMLNALEPEELIEVADARKLYRGDCPSSSELSELFTTDVDKGQALCGNVESRIIDTAVIGLDLYDLELDALEKLAEQFKKSHDLKPTLPGYFFADEWGEHVDLVPLLRPISRNLAVSGDSIEFEDRNRFPRRKRF